VAQKATVLNARPESRSKNARALRWLGFAVGQTGAAGGLIFVSVKGVLQPLVAAPESLSANAVAVRAAREALLRGRSLCRAQGHQGGNRRQIVYAAIRVRFREHNTAAVLVFPNTDVNDEQAFLSDIIRKCMRRADDRPAAAEKTAAPPVSRSPAAKRVTTGSPLAKAPKTSAPELVRVQAATLNALAGILDHGSMEESLRAMADGIAQSWTCQRVTVALRPGDKTQVEAVSGGASFQKRSALVIDIAETLEETCLAASAIAFPPRDDAAAAPQHASLAAQLQHSALLSVPLPDGDSIVGAVLLERDRPFSIDEQRQLEQLAILIGPVLALRQVANHGAITLLRGAFGRHCAVLFGSAYLGRKLAGLAVAVLLVASTFIQSGFRVSADASIQANVQRAVVANVDSFLSTVEHRAGDIVQQGDVLSQLDTEELELERIRWEGERNKLTQEYRASLATRDRSNFRVLEARRNQAEAQIELLDKQIRRATLRAPIDGVVVSGDLTQMLGSPIERGQLLFEVAALDEYRLILMIDESDVGFIEPGQSGHLRLRSLSDQVFEFEVTSVTPVSEPGEGANQFRVEASSAELPATLRPGMEGIAKIDIDDRPIGWIWTRSLTNWLRLQLWKLGL